MWSPGGFMNHFTLESVWLPGDICSRSHSLWEISIPHAGFEIVSPNLEKCFIRWSPIEVKILNWVLPSSECLTTKCFITNYCSEHIHNTASTIPSFFLSYKHIKSLCEVINKWQHWKQTQEFKVSGIDWWTMLCQSHASCTFKIHFPELRE